MQCLNVRVNGKGFEPLALGLEQVKPCEPGDGWVSERQNMRGLLAASG